MIPFYCSSLANLAARLVDELKSCRSNRVATGNALAVAFSIFETGGIPWLKRQGVHAEHARDLIRLRTSVQSLVRSWKSIKKAFQPSHSGEEFRVPTLCQVCIGLQVIVAWISPDIAWYIWARGFKKWYYPLSSLLGGQNGLATAMRETSGLGFFVLDQVRSFDPDYLWCSWGKHMDEASWEGCPYYAAGECPHSSLVDRTHLISHLLSSTEVE